MASPMWCPMAILSELVGGQASCTWGGFHVQVRCVGVARAGEPPGRDPCPSATRGGAGPREPVKNEKSVLSAESNADGVFGCAL